MTYGHVPFIDNYVIKRLKVCTGHARCSPRWPAPPRQGKGEERAGPDKPILSKDGPAGPSNPHHGPPGSLPFRQMPSGRGARFTPSATA